MSKELDQETKQQVAFVAVGPVLDELYSDRTTSNENKIKKYYGVLYLAYKCGCITWEKMLQYIGEFCLRIYGIK